MMRPPWPAPSHQLPSFQGTEDEEGARGPRPSEMCREPAPKALTPPPLTSSVLWVLRALSHPLGQILTPLGGRADGLQGPGELAAWPLLPECPHQRPARQLLPIVACF